MVISSVGGLGESTGAMPIIPPNGPLAICAVGRAKWEVEWVHRDAGMKSSREEVERAGTRAVLRCSVGWSGDHRVVSLHGVILPSRQTRKSDATVGARSSRSPHWGYKTGIYEHD